MLNKSQQQGFTMTELAVGAAIGLIGMVVIFGTFTNSTAISENISSLSDAVQNGSIGLYTIEQDARNAGYGINSDELLGCTVEAYDNTITSGTQTFSFLLSPVEIVKGTPAQSDTLRINYSNVGNIIPSKLTLDYDGTANPLVLTTNYGYDLGTVLLLASAGKPCTMRQVSAIASADGDNGIFHDTGLYTDSNGVEKAIFFNKPGGHGTTYAIGSSVYNLGPTPQLNEYTVSDNKLMLSNRLFSVTPTTVVTDVVQLKASYGAVDDTGHVTFTDTTPANVSDWKKITSIRVALVARSRTPDYKAGRGAACGITTMPVTWSGGVLDLTNTSADWKCYRYRVFETTILLRNMIWTPR